LASQQEAAIVISARDRATGQFRKLDTAVLGVVGRFRLLLGVIGRLLLVAPLLAIGIGAIVTALASITAAGAARDLATFQQAARRAHVQLRTLGISLRDTRDLLDVVTGTLSRASAIGFLGSVTAVEALANTLDINLAKSLMDIAKRAEETIGVDAAIVFDALVDAVNGVEEPLRRIIGTMEVDFDAQVLTSTDLIRAFDDANKEAFGEFPLTNVRRLADQFERINEALRPMAEKLGEFSAAFSLVFVATFAQALMNLAGNPAIVLSIIILGTVIRRGLVGGILGGFAGLLAAGLALELVSIAQAIFRDPDVLLAIAVGATFIGVLTGRWWLAAFLGLMGVSLAPGISEVFSSFTFAERMNILFAALGLLGGLKFIGGFKGAIVGFQFVGAIKEWANIIVEVFDVRGPIGGVLAVVMTALAAFVGSRLLSAFGPIGLALGALLGLQLSTAFLKVLLKMPELFFLDFIKIGRAIANFIWEGLERGLMALLPGFPGPLKEALKGLLPGIPFIDIPSFQHGGIVPGMPGQAVPILAHAGERIIAAGQPIAGMNGGGQPIIVQLVLDKRVIGQVSIDAFHRTAKFQAGMTPGSIGEGL